MVKFILLFIIIYFFIFCFNNKLHISWKTFFKKGFPKKDDLFGLYVYTGKQGEGKTYSCIKTIIDLVTEQDYIPISNIRSFNVFENTIYFENIDEMIDFVIANHGKDNKKYIILFDEIFTILSRYSKLPGKVESFLCQLRKRKMLLFTTAQEWGEIPLSFRRFCRFQVACHMFNVPLFNRAFLINRIGDGYSTRWNDEIQDFECEVVQTNFSKANLSIINSYDTFETIKNNK